MPSTERSDPLRDRPPEIAVLVREMVDILERLASEPDATSSLLPEIDRVLSLARESGLEQKPRKP